uniref:Uncharacterized protein n=1 Tax=Oryza meridionalis TaxID=40149 RepID=A0A0E0CIP1_9ORYZ
MNLSLSLKVHSIRKLRQHEMTSVGNEFNDEICTCFLNNNEHEVLRVGEISMSGVQLEMFVNEGGNADSILKAFVQCFNHDEQSSKLDEARTIIIPPVAIPKGCKFEDNSESITAFFKLIVAALPKHTKVTDAPPEGTKRPRNKAQKISVMPKRFIFFPLCNGEERNGWEITKSIAMYLLYHSENKGALPDEIAARK